MDYRDQQHFLNGSRIWGTLVASAVVALAIVCREASSMPVRFSVVFDLVTIALAIFVYYTPDYLHLTTNPARRARWVIKVRWRIIAAVLIMGLVTASNNHSRIIVLILAAWLLAFNAIAKFVRQSHVPLWLWVGDFVSCTVLLLGPFNIALGALLLSAAAHLAIVASDRLLIFAAGMTGTWSLLLVAFAARLRQIDRGESLLYAGLLLLTVGATIWLVRRAESQNDKNIASAVRELEEFTGYSEEKIKELWATSNQQLAKNFDSASIDPGDSGRLAEWYRQNSELYLFAISGYNLEYKRIRSNLNVLKLGSGGCLDYGAGNGEIVLALAQTGHPAAYFDVQGETMRFARWRAARRRLPVEFFVSKQELLAARGSKGYDTIFSLDVLEHLPDLPGELNFLSSLLNPGGRIVFDVPAGATKSHPMHLNHNLDVVAHLKAKGLKDERSLWQRLPFRKEEKYIFRAR
ncbi:MAG TPA: methyltransferase domain-containing protein [Candidatus Angelobacter sp.]